MPTRSFGAKPPYPSDLEFSDELAPDPFSEQPLPRATTHRSRPGGESVRSDKVKNRSKKENS